MTTFLFGRNFKQILIGQSWMTWNIRCYAGAGHAKRCLGVGVKVDHWSVTVPPMVSLARWMFVWCMLG